ncbi:60S acidic ribosomal protein P0 [Rasamsonia emersonii CBS 393.64]|uniref:Ribosome assembly factor mrt4 n=1 Tax=Rasamsonia emersonii (strain ATCC 16479 / CBS 393.64 / IMI 116815) TaxID=1408163 RepID=A0A0F4YP96_RASE3|nr:60S acidic ribosomal protein P0 [Rasamsonia emersonii CBS 393.64]KKA19920.1 60S acidic ribosomal protein P0 [Rasamsonia emersonii CBS 393.64]
MPLSKRARIVHESKTTKKNHKEQTRRIYANVRECVDNCLLSLLLLFCANVSSSLFFGKTKVMAVALGHTPETEYAPNLHQLSPFMTGAIGLLFTSRDPQSVLSFFESFRPLDFARAGTVSPRDFVIPAGLVYSRAGEIPLEEDEPISHTVEPTLRRLGVPTKLVKGKVMLELNEGEEGYPVCRKGETLDSRQTTLLKMFGIATAEFRVSMKAHWNRKTGEVTVLEKKDDGEMEVEQ